MGARVAFLFLVVVQGVLIEAQNAYTECNKDTMRLCRANIEDVILGNGNTRRLDLEDQCWRIRQNFDCVQWQTSMCLKQEDQEENGDVIRKAWGFLGSVCENFKNWWTKPCYKTAKLKQCENLLTSRGRSSEACRGFINFRECATSAISRDCESDDQRLLGVYLMDKGQQKSWNCPKDDPRYSSPINAPLASNSRDLNSRDIMYSDSAASYGACAYDMAKQLLNCLSIFEEMQKSARESLDEEKMKKQVCCGFVEYEHCAVEAAREKCGDAGYREAKKVVSETKTKMRNSCEDYDMQKCSSAPFYFISNAWLIVGFVLCFLISNLAVYAV